MNRNATIVDPKKLTGENESENATRWYKEDATTSFVASKLGLKSCGDRQKEREALSIRRIKQSMRLQNI